MSSDDDEAGFEELESGFYLAEDAADRREGARIFASLLRACGAPAPIRSDAELWPRGGAPPALATRVSLLHSVASNALGELRLDEALELGFPSTGLDCEPLQLAIAHFDAALRSWPRNAPALFSLGQIRKDRGQTCGALELFGRAAELPTADPAGAGGKHAAWREVWVFAPRRPAVAAGAMTAALLHSQAGEHGAALPLLRRFGFRLRLSPHVWAAAASSPPPAPLGAPPPSPPDPVRLYADAVPDAMADRLRRAFAPSAAYWRETGYHTASSEKRYFTFFYSCAARPSNAVEALIARLRPLLGRQDLACAEWWVHTRPVGRHPGHELHYDLEESLLEASGRVLHPLVSSVVYLSGGASAGPTIVLDERLSPDGEPPQPEPRERAGKRPRPGGDAPSEAQARAGAGERTARRCWLAHPLERGFFSFPGHLLHGVLPVDAPPRAAAGTPPLARRGEPRRRAPAEADGWPAPEQPGAAGEQRLTLLVAWYGEDVRSSGSRARGRGLGPQGAVPRPSRRVTWPRDLEMGDERPRVGPPGAARVAAPERAPRQVPVVGVAHAWEPLPAPEPTRATAPGGGANGPLLEVPCHLDQHFFMRTPDDVRQRLLREHGLDGTWTKAAQQQAAHDGGAAAKPAMCDVSFA